MVKTQQGVQTAPSVGMKVADDQWTRLRFPHARPVRCDYAMSVRKNMIAEEHFQVDINVRMILVLLVIGMTKMQEDVAEAKRRGPSIPLLNRVS